VIKDRAYYGLSRDQRMLALSGVPINYIKKPIELNQLNFAPTMLQAGKNNLTVINPDQQLNLLLDFFNNLSYVGEPANYYIGSYPTDQASYQMAAMITSIYYEYTQKERIYPKIKWIDLGAPEYDYLQSDEKDALIVIHGLSDNSDVKRIELAKDFIRKCANTTKIILATTPQILNFAVLKMGVSPDAVFQLSKTTTRLVM